MATVLPKKGFSLIELLIVLVVFAILAAIAYPSYIKHVLKSNRSEALTNLLKLQTLYEQYYAQNNSYPDGNTLPPPADNPIPQTNYYQYGSTTSTTGYTLTATPRTDEGHTTQSQDTGCTNLSIDNTGNQQPASCWKL